MNHCDDFSRDDASPCERRLVDDLLRLSPRQPSEALRDRVAAALAEPLPAPVASSPSSSPSVGWRWLAERLAWAGAGAVAATLLAGLFGPRATEAVTPIAAPGTPASPVAAADPAPNPPDEQLSEPVAEESLAWSDEGVRYLADGFPARIYRHWVLERHPDPSGRESFLPREDVFVVPVALR